MKCRHSCHPGSSVAGTACPLSIDRVRAWCVCACVRSHRPQEAGYNGIHFNQVAHSWVRDVRVVNSDSAFYSWGMVFCTITGLEVASGNRGYDNGHRGIWLERGQDNLIVNFNFSTMMYHDMSVSFYEHSTAFVNGTGKVSALSREERPGQRVANRAGTSATAAPVLDGSALDHTGFSRLEFGKCVRKAVCGMTLVLGRQHACCDWSTDEPR